MKLLPCARNIAEAPQKINPCTGFSIAVVKVLESTQNQFARGYKYNKQCGLIDGVSSFGLHANSDC